MNTSASRRMFGTSITRSSPPTASRGPKRFSVTIRTQRNALAWLRPKLYFVACPRFKPLFRLGAQVEDSGDRAAGFIGRHVVEALLLREHEVFPATLETTGEQLGLWAKEADAVVHLAGSNRPKDESEFAEVNRDFTVRLLELLRAGSKRPKVILSSSTQAELSNPYGASKLAAERALEQFVISGAGSGIVFRFPNVFGKWCQPNYNSVVAKRSATTRSMESESIVNDPEKEITFVYIDDVVSSIIESVEAKLGTPTFEMRTVPVEYKRKLSVVHGKIESFREMRHSLRLPGISLIGFTVSLYATYLSYLPPDGFAYSLDKKADERGSLANSSSLSTSVRYSSAGRRTRESPAATTTITPRRRSSLSVEGGIIRLRSMSNPIKSWNIRLRARTTELSISHPATPTPSRTSGSARWSRCSGLADVRSQPDGHGVRAGEEMTRLKVATILGTRPEIIRLSRTMSVLDREMNRHDPYRAELRLQAQWRH